MNLFRANASGVFTIHRLICGDIESQIAYLDYTANENMSPSLKCQAWAVSMYAEDHDHQYSVSRIAHRKQATRVGPTKIHEETLRTRKSNYACLWTGKLLDQIGRLSVRLLTCFGSMIARRFLTQFRLDSALDVEGEHALRGPTTSHEGMFNRTFTRQTMHYRETMFAPSVGHQSRELP